LSTTTLPVAEHADYRQPRVGPAVRRIGSVVSGVLLSVVRVVAAPHKASLARLWDIPLTVTGAGFVDFAAFHVAHGWGWLVTGLSLVVIEHLISDEG
jgi:hypothetical protein